MTGVMRAATFGRSAFEVNTGPAVLTVIKFLEHPDHNQLRLFNLEIDGVTVKAEYRFRQFWPPEREHWNPHGQ